MTAEQLRRAGIELLGGERGWQTQFAAMLKITPGALSRYLSGILDVPGPIEVAAEALLANKRRRRK